MENLEKMLKIINLLIQDWMIQNCWHSVEQHKKWSSSSVEGTCQTTLGRCHQGHPPLEQNSSVSCCGVKIGIVP